MNRRQFLQTSGALMAGAALSGCSHLQWSRAKPIGANGDIRVAVIGFNTQGKTHIKAYQSIPGVRLVALCDVDAKVLNTQAEELGKQNIRVKTYRDIRELLDNKEIDA